jgi:hypothetical protein
MASSPVNKTFLYPGITCANADPTFHHHTKGRNKMESAAWFVGFPTLLMIALKLTGHIAWSWWWVLSPLWGSAAIASMFLAIIVSSVIVFDRMGGQL